MSIVDGTDLGLLYIYYNNNWYVPIEIHKALFLFKTKNKKFCNKAAVWSSVLHFILPKATSNFADIKCSYYCLASKPLYLAGPFFENVPCIK